MHQDRLWRELCERAQNEKDSAKLLELTQQILELFEARDRRQKSPSRERGKETPKQDETWESMT
jgi:hypothetical protein